MELVNNMAPPHQMIGPEQYVDLFVQLSTSDRIVKNNLNRYINKIGDISFRVLLVIFASYKIYANTLAGHSIEPNIAAEVMGDRDDDDFSQSDFIKINTLLDRGAIAKDFDEHMESVNTWYNKIQSFLIYLSEMNETGYNSATSAIRRAIKQSALSLIFILKQAELFGPVVDAIGCVTDSANCKNPIESMTVILIAYGAYPWLSQLLAYSIATAVGFIVGKVGCYLFSAPLVITSSVASKVYESYIKPMPAQQQLGYDNGFLLIPSINNAPPLVITRNLLGANVAAMMVEGDVSLTLTGYILGQPLYYGPPALARGLFSLVKKAPAAMSFLVTSLGGGASVVSMLAAIYVDTVLAHGTPILTVISMVSSAHTIMTQEDDGDDVVGGGDSSNGSNGASVISVSSSRVVHDGNNETLIMDYSVCNKTPTNSRLSISSLSDSSCETETRMLQINVEELRLAILALLKSKLKHSGSRSKSRSKLRRVKTNRSNRSNRSKRHKKRVAKSNGYTKNKKRTNYRTV